MIVSRYLLSTSLVAAKHVYVDVFWLSPTA